MSAVEPAPHTQTRWMHAASLFKRGAGGPLLQRLRVSELWTCIVLAVLVHVGIGAMLLLDHGKPRPVDPTATLGAGAPASTLESRTAAPVPSPLPAPVRPQVRPAPEPPSADSRHGASVAGRVTPLPAETEASGAEVNAAALPAITVAAEPAPPAPQRAGQKAMPPASRTAPRAPERAAAQATTKQPAELVVQPSFNCRLARSTAEKIICSDAALARLDRDLGRLYARARTQSRDPAAFRRQQQVEWRRREQTCTSRQCLIEWYARRRQQLTDIIAVAPAGDARRQRTR